jgi:hypothetical protein
MDLNWYDHPMGIEYDGWDPTEIAIVREILAFFNYKGLQLIWWGNDWDSPKDSMHFQMGYGTYQDPRVDEFIAEFILPDGFSTFRRKDTVPGIPRKLVIPDAGGCFWNDVSQYQVVPVDDSYKYRIFSFRTNSGDKLDTLADENARRAKQMLDAGKLDIVIPYYFFRPGEANCDLHRVVLTNAGLFNHPRTVTMVDVEGAAGQVTGDNSWEINDEIGRIRGWYGNYQRVIGYLNPNADPTLWTTRGGINLVIPQYNPVTSKQRTPGDISTIRDSQAKIDAIAHQFTSTATDQNPWNGTSVDVNWSPYSVDELLQLFGMVNNDEDDFMAELTSEEIRLMFDRTNQIWGALFNPVQSGSRYREDYEGDRWPTKDLVRNIDKVGHEESTETNAIRGNSADIKLVARNSSRGDSIAMSVFLRIPDDYLKAAGINDKQAVVSAYDLARQQDPNRTVFALPPKG